MAGLPDDYNEDDFEEYNPHPYLGGYDIVQIYGRPLPPSPAICYPLSQSRSDQAPPPPAAPPAAVPSRSPPDQPPAAQAPDEPAAAAASPPGPPVVNQPWFEPHPYGEPYQAPPYKPDLFRSWPFSIPQHCCRHTSQSQVRGFDYWNHMMRGLDFLFGHANGYGERTVGIDVYGVPVYANKATPSQSLALQVDQPPVHNVQFHHSSDLQLNPQRFDTWPSWCEESKEETNENSGSSYQSDGYYNYEQSTSNWDVDSSYRDTYDDWRRNNAGYTTNVVEGESMEENTLFSTPLYAYNKHYYEQPLHVQAELTDQIWTQKMISYENDHSSYYIKEEEVDQPNILSHDYERERYEQTQYKHITSSNPSWSHNVGYFGENLEGETVRSDDYSTFYGGERISSTSFAYNEENIRYEQNQSSWATSDGQVLYGEDTSYKPSWDDDPRNWADAIFGSSHNYYAYDH